MHKGLLKAGAVSGAITVILGAFAAHALRARLSAESLSIFETGVRYQFYHAFALILAGILYKEFPFNLTVWAGKLFFWGTILFSGSLYLLTYIKHIGKAELFWIGAITPFGGAAFIVGWILLLRIFFRKHNP